MPEPAGDVLLSVRDLRVEYRTPLGVTHAVRGVDLDIRQGESVGIVGESGCGKTAVALGMLRLLAEPPARVSASRILIDGVDITSAPAKRRRQVLGRSVGVVFQDPLTSLDPLMRVGHQISEGPRYHHGLSKKDARVASQRGLEEVRIPDAARRIDEFPHQMSGGMRQRAMIAAALAAAPRLLVADEPTTALDVTVQAQILRLVRGLRQEHGLSLLWISHDIAVVAAMADRIVVMYAGRIVEEGPVRQILRSPSHPYTRALLASVPRIGDSGQRLKSIGGSPPDLMQPVTGCSFYPRCELRESQCLDGTPGFVAVSRDHSSACRVISAVRK